MTHKDQAEYHNDVVKAERMYRNNKTVSNDLVWIFRDIHKRRWNAEMNGTPYTSVFEEASL